MPVQVLLKWKSVFDQCKAQLGSPATLLEGPGNLDGLRWRELGGSNDPAGSISEQLCTTEEIFKREKVQKEEDSHFSAYWYVVSHSRF